MIDPRTIAPLDREAILDSVRKTGRLVITHDAHKTAGIGAEIATLVVEGAFDALKAPPERVAALDVPIPSGPLLVEVYPNADGIIAAVRRTLGKGRA